VIGCVGELEGIGNGTPPPNADPQAGCALGCHGTEASNAPPKSISGAMETTAVAVGAHQAHLNVAASWHRPVACADCHAVPAEVSSPGHMDGDGKAELTFGTIAGANAMWNGETCTVNCHGSSAIGGANPVPVWTKVDGTQSTCGSCHGAPPPAPHPADTNCATCHPTMEESSLTFRDPSRHIDGVVDVVAGVAGGCTSCHGSETSSAPPRDLAGNTAPTALGVGAHAAHLAPSTWRHEITCSNCHVVPLTVDAPGHRDGDNIAEVVFDLLNPAGTYTRSNATCANQYCHGTGTGNNGTAVWNVPGTRACGSCHSMNGTNMSGDHRKHIVGEGMRCSQCHADVVTANQTILNANLHINGVHEVKMANGTFNPATRTCANTGCHGTERW
jgi:predicted CxxxxCH...CXXCH cytochrome family protein